MKIARLRNNIVVELAPEGATLESFHPDAGFVEAPDDVVVGAVRHPDGWFAEPPPPPRYVPQTVALWQARAALDAAGRFAAVDAYVEERKETNRVLYEAWNYGNSVSRGGLFVNAIGPALGLTSEQIDDLFIAAAAIQA